MTQKRIICSIYRSKKKDEMYLYVDKTKALSLVPEALLVMFGKPVQQTCCRKLMKRAIIYKCPQCAKSICWIFTVRRLTQPIKHCR